MEKTIDPKDESRIAFCCGNAHSIRNLSEREAKLVDDISENGERELNPFERHMIDRMMKLFKEQR